jgi:ABC-type thiamin/hydroxymethylpyrimidine transport system permease subunit
MTMGGKRTSLIVFDLADPSQIPVIAEPLFQGLDAEIEFAPVMNQEDLMNGLSAREQTG